MLYTPPPQRPPPPSFTHHIHKDHLHHHSHTIYTKTTSTIIHTPFPQRPPPPSFTHHLHKDHLHHHSQNTSTKTTSIIIRTPYPQRPPPPSFTHHIHKDHLHTSTIIHTPHCLDLKTPSNGSSILPPSSATTLHDFSLTKFYFSLTKILCFYSLFLFLQPINDKFSLCSSPILQFKK